MTINILAQIGELTDTSLQTLQVILQSGKKYIDSEEIKEQTKFDGRVLGSTLSALSKQLIDNEPYIVPFGRKSLKVNRERNGKNVEISMPVQVWEVNQKLFDNKEVILERINEILKILLS